MPGERKTIREDIAKAMREAMKPFIGQTINSDLIHTVETAVKEELTLLLDSPFIPRFRVTTSYPDRVHVIFDGDDLDDLEKKAKHENNLQAGD